MPTLSVVKKYSPGDSCRKRTPCATTGSSKSTTRSLEKQKQARIEKPATMAARNTRSRSSSKCSQMDISTSGTRDNPQTHDKIQKR